MSDELINSPVGDRVALVRLVADLRGRDEAERYMDALGLNIDKTVKKAAKAHTGSAEDALRHLLLVSKIEVDSPGRHTEKQEKTVLEHIKHILQGDLIGGTQYDKLCNHGIRIRPNDTSCIAIAKDGIVERLFEGTEWALGKHFDALKKLPGAQAKQTKFNSWMKTNAVIIPLSAIEAVE